MAILQLPIAPKEANSSQEKNILRQDFSKTVNDEFNKILQNANSNYNNYETRLEKLRDQNTYTSENNYQRLNINQDSAKETRKEPQRITENPEREGNQNNPGNSKQENKVSEENSAAQLAYSENNQNNLRKTENHQNRPEGQPYNSRQEQDKPKTERQPEKNLTENQNTNVKAHGHENTFPVDTRAQLVMSSPKARTVVAQAQKEVVQDKKGYMKSSFIPEMRSPGTDRKDIVQNKNEYLKNNFIQAKKEVRTNTHDAGIAQTMTHMAANAPREIKSAPQTETGKNRANQINPGYARKEAKTYQQDTRAILNHQRANLNSSHRSERPQIDSRQSEQNITARQNKSENRTDLINPNQDLKETKKTNINNGNSQPKTVEAGEQNHRPTFHNNKPVNNNIQVQRPQEIERPNVNGEKPNINPEKLINNAEKVSINSEQVKQNTHAHRTINQPQYQVNAKNEQKRPSEPVKQEIAQNQQKNIQINNDHDDKVKITVNTRQENQLQQVLPEIKPEQTSGEKKNPLEKSNFRFDTAVNTKVTANKPEMSNNFAETNLNNRSNKQSGEQNAVKTDNSQLFNNMVDTNYHKAAQINQTIEVNTPKQVTDSSIVDQVIQKASIELSNNNSQITISLAPANLGRVEINLVSTNGVLTAQITAENSQVKEALTKGIEDLKQNL